MNQRMRSVELYNLDILDAEPKLAPVDIVPERMLPFNYAKCRDISGDCVHFFIDDYQFERVWQFPTRYGYLRRAQCVATPDWSTWTDMPEELQRYNVWRSVAMGAWWQESGMTVIPTLQWSNEGSFEWCFKYVPRGGTVIVSAKGTQNDRGRKELFAAGMREAIRQCEPVRVLLVGDADFDFSSVEVVRYPDTMARRFQDGRKGRLVACDQQNEEL